MGYSEPLRHFQKEDLVTVKEAVSLAEEITIDAYRLSNSQWRRQCYDVKTLVDLHENEIVHGPFAQIIRYVGRKTDSSLGSSQYDFYKICLQDHAILNKLDQDKLDKRDALEELRLFPFMVYIVCHELIHVVRFTTFQQSFEASPEEKMLEEARVHQQTQAILAKASVKEMAPVFAFYRAWDGPIDALQEH